jgi:uncharacterized protein YcbX
MSTTMVSSLRRYPVKSMSGEELASIETTSSGFRGDRAYALIDTATGTVGSAKGVKRFGALLKWHATFLNEPTGDGVVPPVRITSPDGRSFVSDGNDATTALSDAFGPSIALRSKPPEGLRLQFDAGTLGGKHAYRTSLPLASAAPGTFFDLAAVHIITTSTLRSLKEANFGKTVDVGRFRPNVIADSGDDSGFVENGWVGRTLHIGQDAVVRVSWVCPRCIMPTLAQGDLAADPKLLRTIAQHNLVNLGDYGRLPCAGIYADVLKPGRIGLGDRIRILD